jgi:hypothetical protein
MPAYRERIYICAGEDGRPLRVVDFPTGWNRRAFFQQYGQRRIDSGNPFYVDDGLLLSAGEAMAWHQRCKEALADDPEGRAEHIVGAMERLESMLKTASWIIVESYEWESGLD